MKNGVRTGLALAGFAALTLASGALGAVATGKSRSTWYRTLRKPRFNPPDRVFAPVWTTLYALSSVSATRVYRADPSADRTRALMLWGAQQTFNTLWSPLFFARHRASAALVDLGLLWATLAAYAKVAKRVDRHASELVLPYLGWVTFAGVLNGAILRKNPRLLRH
jgi:tryptophan-rich sensory protein